MSPNQLALLVIVCVIGAVVVIGSWLLGKQRVKEK